MIVHHTDCGLAKLQEDDFRAQLARFAGYRPTWSVQAFKDPHDSVRESLRRVRDSPFLQHTDAVRGFIFDVETGLLEEVFVDEAVPTGQLTPVATPPPAGADACRGRGRRFLSAEVVEVPSTPLDADLLIAFFDEHGRQLPWREPTASPWAVLVSEVMLQQTPVIRVLPVFSEWMERWPTPADLAADSPAAAIRMWGRLGYPRRALRLHAAATAITVDHRGVVPDTVETLLTLPGIGEYTARAVAAFAFGARTPVVDTNVRRVLSRVVRGVDEPREPATTADRALMTTLLPVEPAARRQVLGRRDGAGRAGLLGPVARPARACPLADRCRWRLAGSPARRGTDGRCRPGTAPTGRSVGGSWRRCGPAMARCLWPMSGSWRSKPRSWSAAWTRCSPTGWWSGSAMPTSDCRTELDSRRFNFGLRARPTLTGPCTIVR